MSLSNNNLFILISLKNRRFNFQIVKYKLIGNSVCFLLLFYSRPGADGLKNNKWFLKYDEMSLLLST